MQSCRRPCFKALYTVSGIVTKATRAIMRALAGPVDASCHPIVRRMYSALYVAVRMFNACGAIDRSGSTTSTMWSHSSSYSSHESPVQIPEHSQCPSAFQNVQSTHRTQSPISGPVHKSQTSAKPFAQKLQSEPDILVHTYRLLRRPPRVLRSQHNYFRRAYTRVASG